MKMAAKKASKKKRSAKKAAKSKKARAEGNAQVGGKEVRAQEDGEEVRGEEDSKEKDCAEESRKEGDAQIRTQEGCEAQKARSTARHDRQHAKVGTRAQRLCGRGADAQRINRPDHDADVIRWKLLDRWQFGWRQPGRLRFSHRL
jgi:hypothetical protein